LLSFFIYKQYRKVGPNEILIISGGKKNVIKLKDGTEKAIGFRFRIGGGTFVNPFTESVERFPIEVIPIHSKISEAPTSNGIPITAEFNSQVKIDTNNDYSLYLAITNFLSKGTEGIHEVAETILESRVRELIGGMSVEDIFSKRSQFTDKISSQSQLDFEKLGLSLMSFGLRDVTDSQGYIDALSQPHITRAKYEAEVDKAEKDRDITIKSAQAKKDGEVARLAADAEIAKANWDNEAKKAQSQVSVNEQKARADMAYELERYKIQQDLKREEYAVKKIEMEENIGLDDLNIARKQKELEANVLKPAEARKLQVQQEAEAESYRLAKESSGKIEALKAENQAEAERIRLLGQAEADAIAEKAKSYANYNDAALHEMILARMPEIAKAISEPLSRLDKIVMIEQDGKLGTSKITGQVTEILSQLPEVIESLTGADLRKILKKKDTEKE
ncbi:MAG: flotillin, partial [Caldithrix sp.]|nr:flotillin [Caldithrix sp.]